MAIERPDWGNGAGVSPVPSTEGAAIIVPARDDGGTSPAGYDGPMRREKTDDFGGTQADKQSSHIDGTAPWSAMSPETIARWEERGGAEHHFKTAQAVGSRVLATIPEEDRDAFTAAFTQSLGNELENAAIEVLGWGGRGTVRPASANVVARFGEDDAGALCLRQWGGRAPDKVARYLANVDDIVRLAGGDEKARRKQIGEWLDSCTLEEAVAQIEALAR